MSGASAGSPAVYGYDAHVYHDAETRLCAAQLRRNYRTEQSRRRGDRERAFADLEHVRLAESLIEAVGMRRSTSGSR